MNVCINPMSLPVQVRLAVAADIPALRSLIELSVRRLQAQDYSPEQLEAALKTVFGVDSQLIADGTYLVAEVFPSHGELAIPKPEAMINAPILAGCGGWSKRKTLYGGDRWRDRRKTICSTPTRMPQRYARSLFIPTGRGAALAPWCWMRVKLPPGPRASRALKWAQPSPE